ncbi:MAG: mechanosensitive ion channel [Proteobacteria bacterium]|nr:mechanosensitive ion channel [Pseudomonadota bacterium]
MHRLLTVLTLLLGVLVATPPHAAEPAPEQKGVTAQNLESLVQTLEDPERRDALLNDLRTLLDAKRETRPAEAETGAGAELLAILSERVGAVSGQLVAAAAFLIDLPELAGRIVEGFADAEQRGPWLEMLLRIALVLLAAFAVASVLRRALQRPREAIETRADDHFGLTFVLLLARTLLDLLPIAGFAAAGFGALTVFGPAGDGRIATVALIDANVIVGVVLALARMCLAPFIAGLRLFPLEDETAHYIYVWIKRLTVLSVYGYFTIQAAMLLGLPDPAHNALLKLLGLAVGLLLIMIALQNRHDVAACIRGEGRGPLPILRRRLADIWHILFIIYLLCSFTAWALEIHGGFAYVARATILTATIILIGRILELAIHKAVQRAFALGQELKIPLPGLEARANRYLPVVQAAGRSILYLFALFAILQIWGLDVYSWIASPSGRMIIGRAVTVALVVIAAIAIWEIVSALIERSLIATDGDGNAITHSQRMLTLLPLLRNAFLVLLVVLVTMTVLSELGLNIAPLLAGAGVVGLAIGFGAQTLVKDVITGLFILIEDTISVGDVVNVAGHAGVVEAVTIRTIRLRDLSGTVHIIPLSDVTSIENLTREFAFALLDIGIAYREDVDAVIEVIKTLGTEIREDPEYSDKILENIQILGLDRFDDSAVIIRARIKTLPLQKWTVKRGFNLIMKRRFDELGIEIPFPHQTIYFGEDKNGNAPPAPFRLMQDTAARTATTASDARDTGDTQG